MEHIDISVTIGNIRFKNPLILASGTCGYGREVSEFINLNKIGGLVTKGLSLKPKTGNPPPRVIESPCGLINSIGLENIGIEQFIEEKIIFLREIDTRIIVNIFGETEEEYWALSERLSLYSDFIDGIEVNISCPNVKKGGRIFGVSSEIVYRLVKGVVENSSLPVWVKMSPQVSEPKEIAIAIEESGADAISLINTIPAMAIDIFKRKPKLGNIIGGLSGPAIKPVAIKLVWEVHGSVNIPIIGIGGIMNWEDAIEFILAGASAVQVGTLTLIDPGAVPKIITGIEQYMIKNGIESLNRLIGGVKYNLE